MGSATRLVGGRGRFRRALVCACFPPLLDSGEPGSSAGGGVMILECACGKMYRVRDDAANQPTKCPVCGGTLRQAGGSSPSIGAEPKLKEQETRVHTLEQERNDAHERAERLERERGETRAGPASSHASAPLPSHLTDPG